MLVAAGHALGQDTPSPQDLAERQTRSASEIIEAYDAVAMPEYDASRRGDSAYQAEFSTERRAADLQRAELIGELLADYPTDKRLADLLPVRWRVLLGEGRNADVITEARASAEHAEDPMLRLDALYFHAIAVARDAEFDPERTVEAADLFYQANARDPRNARLLMLGTINQPDASASLEIYRRLASEYPDTREGQRATDKVYQFERIGTPFELAFNDAISGEPVDVASLRGRVVVVVFWASWCPSCRAEMAELNALRNAYADKGAAFVGVSLDQPRDDDPARDGLMALRSYVEANGIAWPQYYQGDGWDSVYSGRWRVRSIPTVFVIDQEGRLVTPDARGSLGELIPGLLGIEPVRDDSGAPAEATPADGDAADNAEPPEG